MLRTVHCGATTRRVTSVLTVHSSMNALAGHAARAQAGGSVPDEERGAFHQVPFRYDGATDSYACPGGQRLRPTYFHQLAGGTRIQYVNRKGCRSCGLRPRCTADTHRRISRCANETILERMAERLATRPDLLIRRGASVEHPFGSIKQWMGHGAFLTRQLKSVRGEFSDQPCRRAGPRRRRGLTASEAVLEADSTPADVASGDPSPETNRDGHDNPCFHCGCSQ